MNDQELQEIAAFRFGVIAPVVQRKLAAGKRYALLRELAAQSYTIPYNDSTLGSAFAHWNGTCKRTSKVVLRHLNRSCGRRRAACNK